MIQDRPYQAECEAAILSEYDRGTRRMLASMATGTGKTIVFSKLYEAMKSRLPGQMLILAHTEELVDQNIDKMRRVNPDIKVDKEMAEHKADPSTADVIVASVATLGRKGTKRVENYNWEKVDKLVIDEAHHGVADSYRRIVDYVGSLQPNTNKLLLGFTATPQRGDGRALAELFEKVAYVYSIRQAIEDGWLVDIRGYRVKTDTDISDIKKTAGDYNKEELADRVNNPARNELIVKTWQALGEGRQTVTFCVDIKHAQDLARTFYDAGIRTRAIWGDDLNRALKLEAHRAGKLTNLCNCGVLTEGYDDWRIGCILLARPTQSSVLFTQMVGRGTRLQEGCGNLISMRDSWNGSETALDGGTFPFKEDLIVIDVMDNTKIHSLVTIPTLMGLPAGIDMRGQSLLHAVKQIEALQEKYPSADFSKLESLDKVPQFIEQINLFEVRFPAEVEENSELTWYRTACGGYRINIPKNLGAGKGGHCSIFQNMLDKWEIEGDINGKKFRGTGDKMERAFQVCDEQIRKHAPDVIRVLAREAKWHGKPATENQKVILKRLFPWRALPDNLTKGQASRIIGERLAKKAER